MLHFRGTAVGAAHERPWNEKFLANRASGSTRKVGHSTSTPTRVFLKKNRSDYVGLMVRADHALIQTQYHLPSHTKLSRIASS